MTRREKKILAPTIREVLRSNQQTWRELKREIFDCGFQVTYETTLDFLDPVEHALARLQESERLALAGEWRLRRPDRSGVAESSMLTEYALLILEEISARASVASSRTSDW